MVRNSGGTREGDITDNITYFLGSYSDASFPLVFTNNKKANPTISSTEEEKFRENCVRTDSNQCPPEFKRDHENYFLGRLESPWGCQEEESTVDSNPIKIKKTRRMEKCCKST